MSANQLISIDALRVQSIPAVLSGNFGELNALLDALLADKVTVVTEETLAAEKKTVAELRKLAKGIDAKTKEVLALVSGDIDQFTGNMKELKNRVLAVADDKAAQVTNLENVTRGQIAAMLQAELENEWRLSVVQPEFRKATIDDLIKLASWTSAGNLSKTALMAIKDRVQADYRQQTNILARLLAVENQCLKNDINPPLTRASVEAFLFADDATFYPRLDAMIAAEIARKDEAEARMRAKLEAEKQREIEQALAHQKASMAAEVTAIAADHTATAVKNAGVEPLEPAAPIPADAVTYTITALVSFEIQSRPNASLDKMKAYFTEVFTKEGKHVVSLNVKPKGVRDAA